MSKNAEWFDKYIGGTKVLELATAGDDGGPVIRSLGSFGVEGFDVYFSTGKGTQKVRQIDKNDRIALLFQKEDQEIKSFVNVAVRGRAVKLSRPEDLKKAIEAITAHSPSFSDRVKKTRVENFSIYRVSPSEVKILDFSKGSGPDRLEIITEF